MNDAITCAATLRASVLRLAQLQQCALDRLALEDALAQAGDPHGQLAAVASALQLDAPSWIAAPDPSALPALAVGRGGTRDGRWGILTATNDQHGWVSQWWDPQTCSWHEQIDATLDQMLVATMHFGRAPAAGGSQLRQLLRQELAAQRKPLIEALAGGALINVVALVGSLYSMQVYDRVVPTGAAHTLFVLTLGALGAALFELAARRARARLFDGITSALDQRLARQVYVRFLSVRLDQMPRSVGGLAAQMRGYETVRAFLTSVTGNFLVDAPFAILFGLLIIAIAGPLALISGLFFVLSLAAGCYSCRHAFALGKTSTAANNLRTGLLVESVEGCEIIKSGHGGWRMLARWLAASQQARDSEAQMRNVSERAIHLASTFQQCAYILMLACGALLISKGELTMGALIACSILSGRVLAPIAALPSLLVQWAHARAALHGLERLWALPDDHHGQSQPVVPSRISGQFRFQGVGAGYGGDSALSVAELQIAAGEKIAVLGPVGAGKTTLLRLLSGMYKPVQGRILLDDIDLAHIAKPALAAALAYVPQDGRLFSGTLRDNLILGQVDPGDEAILRAARQTGLYQSVIAPHRQGLQQEIFEGGCGLSGGQRQLVNVTRAFLRLPAIWLLDEPTASMDRQLELTILGALREAIRPGDTVVLVTHKADLLELVDRIIVVDRHRIVLDGPKEAVLRALAGAPEKVA